MRRTLLIAVLILALVCMGMGLYTILRSQQKINSGPSTIFSNENCEPPCWWSLTPGESSTADVMDFLSTHDWIRANMVNVSREGGQTKIIRWGFDRSVGDLNGIARFNQERLSTLAIFTAHSVSLAQVFSRFKQPQEVWTDIEQDRVSIFLFYPQKGFLVILDLELPGGPSQKQIKIEQDTTVDRVIYFEPDRYHELLKGIEFTNNEEILQEDLRPWTGLGYLWFR